VWPLHSASAQLARWQHHLQWWPLRPHWLLPVSCSTTLHRCTLHRLCQSSGATTSTSSSSPPSTRRLIEDDSHLQLRIHTHQQWHACLQPLDRYLWLTSHQLLTHHQLHVRQPRRMYWQASPRLTSRLNSTAVTMVKIAASPSNNSVKGVATSRVITSRRSLTLLHRREKRLLHMLHALLTVELALVITVVKNHR
jgi:hypothetical protein